MDRDAAPDDLAPDAPLSLFADRAGLHGLAPPAGAIARIRGANTLEEVHALLAALAASS